MNTSLCSKPTRLVWSALAATALLAGCGGGGDDAPPPPISLSGVAAVGVPIAGGNVALKCASGAPLTATTSTAGAWQVTFAGQTLPCAVQVSGGNIGGTANTTPYHSIALAPGVVNITPLTDLLVAQLTGTAPSSWFAAPAFSNVTGSTVSAALNKLATGLGIANTLGTTNPITTAFAAQPGNPIDNLLEAFKTALANLSQTYAALLSAAQTGTYAGFSGFGTAFTVAYQAIGSTPSNPGTGGSTPTPTPPGPVAGAGSLTVVTSIRGVQGPAVTIPGIPRPANQTEFCNDLQNDTTFSGISANGGTLTINSCSFANNVGQVAATLAIAGTSLPYSIRYTYN
jgi:hypothetical protein